MKKYILTALAALSLGLSASAQLRTAYFMEGTQFRTDMNPALYPIRGYLNIPVISALQFNLNNNFLSLNNFIYPNPNGEGSVLFLHPSVREGNKFLKKLPEDNMLGFNTTINILGFGAHTRKLFWNVGLNVKAELELNIPKDLFRFMTTFGPGTYDISNLNANAQAYSELFIGFAVPVTDWFVIGARVKGLLGIANIDMGLDKTSIKLTDTEISGKMSGTMRMSSIINNQVAQNSNLDFGDMFNFSLDNLGFKHFGGAIDLGLEVTLLKNLRLSAAVTDLGWIQWHKSKTIMGNISADAKYTGYDFDANEVEFDFSEPEITVGGKSDSYMKRLNTSLNVGAEYTFCKDRLSLGVLSHTRFGSVATHTDLTVSANFRPLSWLSASVSQTLLNNNALGVFGFALNLHPPGINIFAGADFINFKVAKGIPIPVKMNSFNIYTGFGFNIGKARFHKNSKFYKPLEKKSKKKK